MLENLSSVLSLNRLKSQKFREGDQFKVAGRVEYHSATKIILKGQEESETFFIENGFDLSRHHFLKENLSILLQVRVHQNRFLVREVHLLTGSKKQLQSFNSQDFRKWHAFLREVEDFFLKEGLCPVQTPHLVSCPGTEPQLRFFSTSLEGRKLWLASSPELHLKKLLFRNATDIFEIHRCYRSHEKGDINWNEFYMLEWYRVYASMDQIVQDLQNLFSFLKEKSWILFEVKEIQKLFIPNLFEKYCGIRLTPESCQQDLISFLKKKDILYSSTDSFEDLFHLIFLNFIEPFLDSQTPTLVYGYPPSLRAYSKLDSKGWAERFELYWKKIELANAFNEICCVQTQRKVFENDLKKHEQKDLKIDESFLSEMEAGFPPTAGIALGLERLYMVGQGLEKFPLASVFPISSD